jgi:hypothetical protein
MPLHKPPPKHIYTASTPTQFSRTAVVCKLRERHMVLFGQDGELWGISGGLSHDGQNGSWINVREREREREHTYDCISGSEQTTGKQKRKRE